MKSCELIFMDSKSSKFWNIELDGSSHTVNYGRTGTNGQTKTKEFDSADKAKASFEKLIGEKKKKGYVEAGGSSGATTGGADQLPLVAFSSIQKQDDIYQNVKTFVGRKVADYNPEKGPSKGGKTIYRFRSDYDEATLIPHLEHFLASDGAAEAVGIVIGAWGGDDSSGAPDEVFELLAKNKDRLSSLVALFIGDITSEENEMSWIHQSDLSVLLDSFPNLQLLRTRGGEGLSIKQPKHTNLRALAMESGGLPVEVVRSVCTSKFPALEYLELWLGTDEYGGDSTVQDLQPILSGKLFPNLKYLGLRNCHFVDDIAAVVVNSPIIERIETLDLSLGTLSDAGAQALLSIPDTGSLKNVSIHYNYASPKLLKQLKASKISFDTSKPANMEEEEEWRFVAVGE